MFLDPDISEDTWVFQVRRPDAPSEWNICQQNIYSFYGKCIRKYFKLGGIWDGFNLLDLNPNLMAVGNFRIFVN